MQSDVWRDRNVHEAYRMKLGGDEGLRIASRGFEDPQELARRLAPFIPPDVAVLDLGCGSAALRDAMEGGSYVGVDRTPCGADIRRLDVDDEPIPADLLGAADLVVACRLLEYVKDPDGLLRQTARLGRPLVCTFWAADLALEGRERPAGWRREYSHAAFEDLARRHGYEVVYRREVILTLMAAFLAPARLDDAPAYWRSVEGRRFVKRSAKKAERFMERYVAAASGDNRLGSEKWALRAAFASSLIPAGLALLDVGCLGMHLERHARPSRYVPVDMMADDPRIRVIDLNQALLPRAWVEEVDIAVCLGVFEYLDDPSSHIGVVAAAGRPILLSYNVAEWRKTERVAAATRKTPPLAAAEIDGMLENHGFEVVRRLPFGARQMVWLAFPRAARERPAWWDALPESPSQGGPSEIARPEIAPPSNA